MCMGIPLRLVSVNGTNAIGTDAGRTETVDLSLVGTQPVGTWVLSFLGAAREVVTEAEAKVIGEALAGLGRLMAGGELGDAFADLDNREPALPPHLAAAHAAGLKDA